MGSGTKDEWAFTNVLFISGHDGMYPRDKGRGLLTEGHGNLWGGGGSPSCFLGSPWHSHTPPSPPPSHSFAPCVHTWIANWSIGARRPAKSGWAGKVGFVSHTGNCASL